MSSSVEETVRDEARVRRKEYRAFDESIRFTLRATSSTQTLKGRNHEIWSNIRGRSVKSKAFWKLLTKGTGDGIGRGCTFALARSGFRGLIVADINEKNAQATAETSRQYASDPNYDVAVLRTDVSDEASVEAAVHEAMKRFGRIDASVQCAGVSFLGP